MTEALLKDPNHTYCSKCGRYIAPLPTKVGVVCGDCYAGIPPRQGTDEEQATTPEERADALVTVRNEPGSCLWDVMLGDLKLWGNSISLASEHDRQRIADAIAIAIRAAVDEEREACAEAVRSKMIAAFNSTDPWNEALRHAEAAIRARGES